MDPSEYRRQFEAELATAAAAAEGGGSSTAARNRASAVENDPGLALGVLRDASSGTDRRSSALDVITLNVDEQPELFDRLLEIVSDTGLPAELRTAVLATLQQLSFSMAAFPTKRPSYLATLRSMVEEADMSLRRRVIGILAREKDEYIQRRLLDDLEQSRRPLVPVAKAIQFLGYDVHAEYFPLLRRIVEHPPNQAAKREAVRLLAGDPSAADLLSSILSDKAEKRDVRKASAVALQALAPERFEQQARAMVADDDEDDELQALSITALTYFGTSPTVEDDRGVTRRVERLQSRSPSRQLKRATTAYLAQRDG